MVKPTAKPHLTYEIVEEKAAWLVQAPSRVQRYANIADVTSLTISGELRHMLSVSLSGTIHG